MFLKYNSSSAMCADNMIIESTILVIKTTYQTTFLCRNFGKSIFFV